MELRVSSSQNSALVERMDHRDNFEIIACRMGYVDVSYWLQIQQFSNALGNLKIDGARNYVRLFTLQEGTLYNITAKPSVADHTDTNGKR